MEVDGNGRGAAGAGAGDPYTLPAKPLLSEDILFCIDTDGETGVEIRPQETRMNAITQALHLFIHSKRNINPDHRFAFTVLGRTVTWFQKEFSNEVVSATRAIRLLAPAESRHGDADLTQLFEIAYEEAKKSQELGRILRVILIYCRSSTVPRHNYIVKQKNFTMDVLYLHDKDSPNSRAQLVFDMLGEYLDNVSEHNGYIVETGKGIMRILFRHICTLLSHPLQRCPQDDLETPKQLTRKVPAQPEAVAIDENMPASSH